MLRAVLPFVMQGAYLLGRRCRVHGPIHARYGGQTSSLKLAFAAAPVALLVLAASPADANPLEDILYPADANGVLPIERILDQARASVAGTITEIELEREHGKLIYEVEILTAGNKKVEIEYDAKTGAELSREVKKKGPRKDD
jgi:uncharacterized membrane protein YkoI